MGYDKDPQWIRTAAKLKANGISWTKLSDAVFEAIGERHGYHKLRGALRRRGVQTPAITVKNDKFEDLILMSLQRSPCTLHELSTKYDRGVATIIKAIEKLKLTYDIEENDETYQLFKESVAENKRHKIELNGNTFKFAVISDTHLCSKYQQLTLLNDFYDRVVDFGAKKVYHAGDILDGEKCYRGHQYEVFVVGADAQVDYTCNHYPMRNGVETDFVGGNHDLTFYKSSGIDVGKAIGNCRDDLNYLGQIGAYIEILPNISLYIMHPDGGGAYAVSYKPQRIAAGFQGGAKPRIMMLGHWHEGLTMFERNIHIVLPMSFQAQTPYLMRKGLEPKIGGYLCEMKIEDDSIREFTTTAVTYYRPIHNDY